MNQVPRCHFYLCLEELLWCCIIQLGRMRSNKGARLCLALNPCSPHTWAFARISSSLSRFYCIPKSWAFAEFPGKYHNISPPWWAVKHFFGTLGEMLVPRITVEHESKMRLLIPHSHASTLRGLLNLFKERQKRYRVLSVGWVTYTYSTFRVQVVAFSSILL